MPIYEDSSSLDVVLERVAFCEQHGHLLKEPDERATIDAVLEGYHSDVASHLARLHLGAVRVATDCVQAISQNEHVLEAIAEVVASDHESFGLEEEGCKVLVHLVRLELACERLEVMRQLQLQPDDARMLANRETVRRSLSRVMAIDPVSAELVLRKHGGLQGRSLKALREARAQRFHQNLSLSYREPIKMVRGRGAYLYDEEGQRYLDMVNNVCHVGHCHPRVVAAGQRQMSELNTNTRFLHDAIVRYAERLLALFPDPLSVVMFVNSGSEANELALRMARTHTGREDVVVMQGAYHGNTQGCVDISPYKFDGPGGAGRKAWVHIVDVPDPYRGAYRGLTAASGKAYARDAAERIASLEAPAAFICESIQGVGGQIVMPPEYLRGVYQAVRAAGGVCIADEVQIGFGRVGDAWWGFETQGVVPDIVTLGKPMGNGHPLAACVTTREIADSFANGMEYFNTFGGNPVSCTIGSAVMDVLEEEQLRSHAMEVGAYLLEQLRDMQLRFPIMGDVRGMGLFIGIELVKDPETLAPAAAQADYVVERARQRQILLSTDGPLHNVIKMKPPLVFSRRDADAFLTMLQEVLSEAGARVGQGTPGT